MVRSSSARSADQSARSTDAAYGERSQAEVSLPAINRRGRKIVCRITGTPLTGAGKDVRGVILLMEEQPADVVH